MMYAAEHLFADNVSGVGFFNASWNWAILVQSQVRPRPVVVAHVLVNDPAEMRSAQWNDVVGAFSANGADDIARCMRSSWEFGRQ